jgi:hypothetical protein
MSNWKLMRTWYQTDYDENEPEYVGSFSGVIPNIPLMNGSQIIHVDWSTPGQVEVTFLIRSN